MSAAPEQFVPPQPPVAPTVGSKRPWPVSAKVALAITSVAATGVGLVVGASAFSTHETVTQAAPPPTAPFTAAVPAPMPSPTKEIRVGNQRIPQAPTHREIGIGEAAQASNWSVTIKKVQVNAPEDNPYIKADREKEGKRKGVLTVSTTNRTQEAQRFDEHDRLLVILDQDGNASYPRGLLGHDEVNVFEKAVKPGATIEGVLEFDYYPDATNFRILVCEKESAANHYAGMVMMTISVPVAQQSA